MDNDHTKGNASAINGKDKRFEVFFFIIHRRTQTLERSFKLWSGL